MATYVLTDSPDVDWPRINWANVQYFKFRNHSRDGHPVAQEAFDQRRRASLPTVMWRFDDNDNPPTIVDHCYVPIPA